MSIGQGVWSGWVALTSFLWGAFGHKFFPVFTAISMRSTSGAVLGLVLLLTGIALLACVGAAAGKVCISRGFQKGAQPFALSDIVLTSCCSR